MMYNVLYEGENKIKKSAVFYVTDVVVPSCWCDGRCEDVRGCLREDIGYKDALQL